MNKRAERAMFPLPPPHIWLHEVVLIHRNCPTQCRISSITEVRGEEVCGDIHPSTSGSDGAQWQLKCIKLRMKPRHLADNMNFPDLHLDIMRCKINIFLLLCSFIRLPFTDPVDQYLNLTPLSLDLTHLFQSPSCTHQQPCHTTTSAS